MIDWVGNDASMKGAFRYMTRRFLATLFLISLMLLAYGRWHTALFPELSALASGLLIFEIPQWQRRRWDFVLWPTVAVAVAIATHDVGGNFLISAVAVLVVVLLALRISWSPAIPALSAGLLSVVLHVYSGIYLLSVLVFTVLLVLALSYAPGFIGVSWTRRDLPPPPKTPPLLRRVVAFGALAVLWLVLVFAVHHPLLATPPLFVAAYEQATQSHPYSQTLQHIGLLILGAMLGAGLNMLVPGDIWPSMLAVVLAIGILIGIQMPFVPMLPLTLLPVIIPANSLPQYVMFVAVAAISLLTAAFFLGRRFSDSETRQNNIPGDKIARL